MQHTFSVSVCDTISTDDSIIVDSKGALTAPEGVRGDAPVSSGIENSEGVLSSFNFDLQTDRSNAFVNTQRGSREEGILWEVEELPETFSERKSVPGRLLLRLLFLAWI